MIQIRIFLSLAGFLAAGIRANAIPSRQTLCQRNLEKPALLSNFDLLTAESDRIPPSVKGTATKWTTGKYPRNCYDKAREVIGDSSKLPKCQFRDLEVYDVKYNDCLTGRDPWVVCRCANAELSLEEIIEGMGTVPTGARSNVLHIVTMNAFGGGGGYSDWNSIYCGGQPQQTWFSHESMHCNDRVMGNSGGYSNSKTWAKAIAKDSCVPDSYSNNNPTEDFAQVGTFLNYQLNGHKVNYTGNSTACFSNQLQAVKDFMGPLMKPHGKCFNAPGMDGTVNSKRSEHDIVEADPESDFEDLLPHYPYTHAF